MTTKREFRLPNRWSKINNEAIDQIRALSVDMICNANSGHPGICLGAADIMYALFHDHMNITPNHDFYGRDRFVLSAGHGSALLYSILHLIGCSEFSMDALKNFRQLNSVTAGHPEAHLSKNIEVSTGPLGQGVAMAVGLAIAEKLSNERYGEVISNHTYCLFGDGCFQEGISFESFAIAGKLGLNKLIMLYDSNDIQLDGKVSDNIEINTKNYFKSLGWNYIRVSNGNCWRSVSSAISRAKRSLNKPTVIECKTTIGLKSPDAGTNSVHGAPLSKEAREKFIQNLLIKKYQSFTVSKSIYDVFAVVEKRGLDKLRKHNQKLSNLASTDKKLYDELWATITNKHNFNASWFKKMITNKNVIDATRNTSGSIFKKLFEENKNFICSSADLTSSTKIKAPDKIMSKNDFNHQNLSCGTREFAMTAINIGLVSYGGYKAVGSTFLSFADYCKPAIRIAALSNVPIINVFSHDTITVGEDGPTHQPIEQLEMLRSIPNHIVYRPSSAIDMVVAAEAALNSSSTPSTIITSRSEFKQVNVSYEQAKKLAYVIYDCPKHKLTLYSSGSEVDIAIQVAKKLLKENKIPTRVVAVNSISAFGSINTQDYIRLILDSKKKVSIEFSSTSQWGKYVDYSIGIDKFGTSAKPSTVIESLRLTIDNIKNDLHKWYKMQL